MAVSGEKIKEEGEVRLHIKYLREVRPLACQHNARLGKRPGVQKTNNSVFQLSSSKHSP